ncbi:hypothetical protein PFICI_00488 [Pestalotiopsis fici W106-1]|uniref:SMP-30/Gluconolactonase/LRE-like region domain-containing protein n=1 Tax=Pestalotiopsis fici (strain W106-1 / CGMCC3.15140) TaxID=1229662 RepID=W3XKZ2_PESFW|nr:uncharacterized protein PFICI_00488 [Pestalotiopsis fici W106-1]ETS86660.1 hypothetical protein PFICI_00488 [Pestalotiopsis fici W106-1]
MVNFGLFAVIASLIGSTLAKPVLRRGQYSPKYVDPRNVTLPLPAKTIAQLNRSDTFFENIVARSNGDLLVTLYEPVGSIYIIQEPYSDSRRFSELYNFNPGMDPNGGPGVEYTAILGIGEVELSHDRDEVFVVCGGRFHRGNDPVHDAINGTMGVWEVRFPASYSSRRGYPTSGGSHQQPSQLPKVEVKRIASIPDAGLLNGITHIPGTGAVAVTDNNNGRIYHLDMASGRSRILVDTPQTRPKPVASSGFAVNGIKASADGRYLYWSNSDLISVYRIRLGSDGLSARGAAVELVADLHGLAIAVDDFALDDAGNVWVTTDVDNMLVRVARNGSTQVVVGAPIELTVAGDTAVAFGRTKWDRSTIYVSTNGATVAPVNGTIIEPAKVVAVDARGLL